MRNVLDLKETVYSVVMVTFRVRLARKSNYVLG